MIKTINAFSIQEYLTGVGFTSIKEYPKKDFDKIYREVGEEEEAIRRVWDELPQVEGEAYYIELDKPILNTKKTPYTIHINVNEGKRVFKKVYLLVDPSSNTILSDVIGTTKDVKDEIKRIYSNGYTGNIDCRLMHMVTDGEGVPMQVNYSPSANMKKGEYIVLGRL